MNFYLNLWNISLLKFSYFLLAQFCLSSFICQIILHVCADIIWTKILSRYLCENWNRAITCNFHFPFDLPFSVQTGQDCNWDGEEGGGGEGHLLRVEFYSPIDPHGATSLKYCVLPKNLTAHKMNAILRQKILHYAPKVCIIFGCKSDSLGCDHILIVSHLYFLKSSTKIGTQVKAVKWVFGVWEDCNGRGLFVVISNWSWHWEEQIIL